MGGIIDEAGERIGVRAWRWLCASDCHCRTSYSDSPARDAHAGKAVTHLDRDKRVMY